MIGQTLKCFGVLLERKLHMELFIVLMSWGFYFVLEINLNIVSVDERSNLCIGEEEET